MYLPIGWPRSIRPPLSSDAPVVLDQGNHEEEGRMLPRNEAFHPFRYARSVSSNTERTLFLILTPRSVQIWYHKPCLELSKHHRNQQSIDFMGENMYAVWRPDSTQIVVATTKSYLIFYQVSLSPPPSGSNSSQDTLFEQHDSGLKRQSAELYIKEKFPAIVVSFMHSTQIRAGISCIMAAEEEVVISTKTGFICGVHWDGGVDENFSWKINESPILPYDGTIHAPDLLNTPSGSPPSSLSSRTSTMATDAQESTADSGFEYSQPTLGSASSIPVNHYVTDIKYSSMIGGFSLVFDSGRAAYLPLYNIGSNNMQSTSNTSDQSPVSNDLSQPSNQSVVQATASTSAGTNASLAAQPEIQIPTSSSTSNNTPQSACQRLLFVPELDNAVCTAINHKYQLMVFGLRNAQGVLTCIDNISNSIVKTHHLELSSCAFPDVCHSVGPMTSLQWSPDSTVLATAWQNGGYAIWSVFGSLLACSMSWDYGPYESSRFTPFRVLSFSWGKEGYHLWMVTRKNKNRKSSSTDHRAGQNMNLQNEQTGLIQITDGISIAQFAKSVLSSNQSVACSSEIVLFVSEDRLLIGVGALNSIQQKLKLTSMKGAHSKRPIAKSLSVDENTASGDTFPSTNVENSEIHWEQHPVEVGNHHWNTIPLPLSYMGTNWPVRYAVIDRDGLHVAIAGKTGIAHYSFLTKKWKMFGNETQEKDFEVCGGILWWDDHIVAACYNSARECFELRAYPEHAKLDNQFARICPVVSEVLLMSAFENRLLSLHVDGTIHMFALVQSLQNSRPLMEIIPLNQVIVSNLLVPAECVTCLVLTNLHVESGRKDDSILMNVCGRLFLLEKENNEPLYNGNTPTTTPTPPEIPAYDGTLVFKAVSTLASGVENVWVSPNYSTGKSDRPHLTESLWLSCGAAGMGVWLPLFPHGVTESPDKPRPARAHTFISKRIMLPIKTRIFPLAVLFRDAVVLGAENDTNESSASPILPLCIVSRTSQVYLHHILRELLRRNLGFHAWEIANSCQSLPYFPHSLELLLHEVLEEEATSSQPIPDALLPRVIDFIREFKVFLQTIVHCARKTEPSLWPHLFDVVGSPRALFHECIKSGQLETAASYLIIIRNLEKVTVSRQLANQLLDASLVAGQFELVQDLMRFLKAIENQDSILTLSSGSSDILPSPPPTGPPNGPHGPSSFSHKSTAFLAHHSHHSTHTHHPPTSPPILATPSSSHVSGQSLTAPGGAMSMTNATGAKSKLHASSHVATPTNSAVQKDRHNSLTKSQDEFQYVRNERKEHVPRTTAI